MVRSGAVGPYGGATYQDGIHLNFASGSASTGHYVKAVGAAPTVAAFTSLFTFTCGNQSVYMGPAGLLVSAVTNTPRIEYDASGNVLGLLMEASRTNLALHSDDHTNAAWVKTTMTTAKTSTGPDGVTNSATRLTASAGNALSLQTVVSGSATRAYSVWMRRITGTGNIQMTLDGGVGWTTKTLTSSWQRFDITQAAVTNPVFGIRIVTSGDAIDVYGNQMESAAFASSLIPTTTVSVARTADSCTRTLGSEFVQSVGTMVAVYQTGLAVTGGNQFIARVSDGSYNSANALLVSSGGAAQISTAAAGVFDGLATSSGPVLVANTTIKHAAAWAVNDLACSRDGLAVGIDNTATMFASMTRLDLCSDHSGLNRSDLVRLLRFDYYPTRQTNAFLVSAST